MTNSRRKQLIREIMTETGMSYTAALRELARRVVAADAARRQQQEEERAQDGDAS